MDWMIVISLLLILYIAISWLYKKDINNRK